MRRLEVTPEIAADSDTLRSRSDSGMRQTDIDDGGGSDGLGGVFVS